MELQHETLGDNIQIIKLTGKLDIAGVDQIETQFAEYCSGDKARVIVDLSGVDYLASVGIRMLTINAKSVAYRGGQMVLVRPTAEVKHVLELTGLPAIVPMYSGLESAEAVLMAA